MVGPDTWYAVRAAVPDVGRSHALSIYGRRYELVELLIGIESQRFKKKATFAGYGT
eukprot:SAG31_NODE_749_length_12378_cov_8.688818_3_plen_56_part_00